jgi:hypothetical protein
MPASVSFFRSKAISLLRRNIRRFRVETSRTSLEPHMLQTSENMPYQHRSLIEAAFFVRSSSEATDL